MNPSSILHAPLQAQKPDRDETQAKLAEYELTVMINTYPDSPLLNEAKEKLRDVQEVLAESIMGPARQYDLRKAYPAVIDRCEEIIKKYPDSPLAINAQDRINGADEYARQVLTQLREQLSRHISTIEKGLQSLDSRDEK